MLEKITIASKASPGGISVPVGLYAQWVSPILFHELYRQVTYMTQSGEGCGLANLCVISESVTGCLIRPETFQLIELNLN